MPPPTTATLAKFMKPAIVCVRAASWAAVRALLERAGEEPAIVVDRQHRPVGALSLANILRQWPGDETLAHDWEAAIAPVEVLAASSSSIESLEALSAGRVCVLVDRSGVLLGRLDLGKLFAELSALPAANAERVLPIAPPVGPGPTVPWQSFLEKLPLPLLLQTADGRILARNQSWREKFCNGSPPCELAVAVGESASQWCTFAGSDPTALPPVPDVTDEVAAEPPPLCPLCAGDRATDSWCLTRLPLEDETDAGESLSLVLASDISEQQQLYRELAARNADLAHLNRLKDEFLACISHELKSPLTAIVGLSNLLQQPTLGDLSDRQDRYVKLIHQSGRQLMALVSDILDLTRLESGRLVLKPELTSIQAVCQEAYEAAAVHAASQVPTRHLDEIPFTLDITADLETLEADALRLRQILTHLLSNALKFNQPEGEVGLRVRRWEGWIAFTVWDTGIGIPTASQHLIFQKFQQLETPLTREHEGTGLGLVLAQRLARAHGGDISFMSEAGRGSEFTLLLPPLPPPSSHATANPVARPRPHTSLSTLVLIVETVPRYIDRLSEMLQRLGYRAAIARSSTEAVAKARTLQPRAILLNPFLAPLSGWDVLTLLKSDPHTRQIPTLVMASRADRQHARDLGADGILNLPVDEPVLRESLELSSPTRGATVRRQNLTVLRLEYGNQPELVPPLETALGNLSSQLNCRILEAEDVDQAHLLARIWHPNAVLLDGGDDVPLSYLEALSACRPLASLPLIVLNARVAQAAHELGSLTVFPCLVTDEANPAEAIWSAIQIAAGIEISANDAAPHILVAGRGDRTTNDNRREWSQALVQYLATAGYRSSLAQSWGEVRSQMQQHGTDLLLLDLGVVPPEGAAALQCELSPLLLGDKLGMPAIVLVRTPETDAGRALAEFLQRIAAKVLPGHSQSMADLLAHIDELLDV